MAKDKRSNNKYGSVSVILQLSCLTCLVFCLLPFALCLSPSVLFAAQKSQCVECHRKVSPGLVQQHLQSKMAKSGVDCSACHGSDHNKMDDAKLAVLPATATCAGCHKAQADQLKSGKHAGMDDNMDAEAGRRYGNEQCDACHSRHLFSKLEAQNPNVCRACHPSQWEIWSASRHGIIWQIDGKWSKRVPTCQTCHMPNGNHSIMGNAAGRFEALKTGNMFRICIKCHGASYIKTKSGARDCSFTIPAATGHQ